QAQTLWISRLIQPRQNTQCRRNDADNPVFFPFQDRTRSMSDSGAQLEKKGQRAFERMGILCCGQLADAPISSLNPRAAARKGEHLEIDYLIPLNDVCLVGEITSR